MALTYENWMSRTKKNLLTTRSSELKDASNCERLLDSKYTWP